MTYFLFDIDMIFTGPNKSTWSNFSGLSIDDTYLLVKKAFLYIPF